MIHGHDLPADAFGGNRVVNLPGLSVTVREMVRALERVAGPEVVSRIRWEPRRAHREVRRELARRVGQLTRARRWDFQGIRTSRTIFGSTWRAMH